MNSDTAVYISIDYGNEILFYHFPLSAGEDTNFSHSKSAAAFVSLASALPAALACDVHYFYPP